MIIRTYFRRPDSLGRRLHQVVSPTLFRKFVYLLQGEGDVIRVAGSEKRMSIREFEDILADLPDSAEALAKQFKSAEQEIKNS